MVKMQQGLVGYCPLASGSKGNCIYLGTEKIKVLIDAGLSMRATKLKLAEIGVEIEQIDAILITHEHIDHIQGLKQLARHHRISVLANHATAKEIRAIVGEDLPFKIFTTGEPFALKDLEVHPFSIQHDTMDPVAFSIKTANVKLGFCTDLGFVTSLVRNHLRDCHYLYVEANHEPSMVHACARPMVYKQRVLSRSGHLSNDACKELLVDVVHKELRHVHLAHLSSECNAPEAALSKIGPALREKGYCGEISIAPQHMLGKVIAFPQE